jgi:TRAP-type transport system periplasmic protein
MKRVTSMFAVAVILFAGGVGAQDMALSMGHVLDARHPVQLGAARMAETAAKLSNGRLKITIFPSSQLGSDREMLQNTQSGTIGGVIDATAKLANFVPQFGVLDLPYLVSDREQAGRMLASPVVEQELNARAAAAGFRIVNYWEILFRNVYTRNKPVNSVADLKGLKIRVIPAPAYISLFRTLGASPTPMSFGELYMAMQQGVVDGAENDLVTFLSVKHTEVAKHLSMTNHIMLVNAVMISEKHWARMPEDMKAAMRQAAAEGRKLCIDEGLAREKSALEQIKAAGVKVYEPDLKPFVAAGRSTYKEFEGRLSRELIEKIVAVAK